MNDTWKAIGFFFAMLVLVLAGVYATQWLNNTTETNNNQNTSALVVRSEVDCPADIESYTAFIDSGVIQEVSLISERKTMFAANGKFINSQVVVTKNETDTSKVACGYLLAKAGTGNNGALKSWENLYINPVGFGGHIDSENSFGRGDGDKFSEYLFSLNKIEYWKTHNDIGDSDKLQTAHWDTLLNVQDSITFDIALNTTDTSGFIDQLSIAYKCWNPKTGEENSDCKIISTSQPDIQSQSLK